MAQPKHDPLSVEQLGGLAEKSLRNSVQLLDEADYLLAYGRHARAYSLGILAAEEYGKHMMCIGALGRESDDTQFWDDFWKRFTGHHPKYINTAKWVVMHLEDEDRRREFRERLKQHVDSDQARKFAGLYVDVDDGGEVVAPDEAISPSSAKDLLFVLGVVVRTYADHVTGFDWTANFRRDWDAAAEVQEALKAGDRERLTALFLKRGGIDLDG